MEKSKVYFTKNITPEAMIQMYEALGLRLPGKVAVKVHSGEMGNQNFIRPEFMQPIIHHVKGTVVECNTAYEGKRNTTKEHWETMASHGWTRFFQVDIMDEEGETELPVSGGKQLSVNYVGDHFKNYDSVLVLKMIAHIIYRKLWANISRIMIPFSFFPISKGIPWAGSAER